MVVKSLKGDDDYRSMRRRKNYWDTSISPNERLNLPEFSKISKISLLIEPCLCLFSTGGIRLGFLFDSLHQRSTDPRQITTPPW